MGLNQQNNMDWGVVPSISDNRPVGADSTSPFWMIGDTQQWNDTWSTFLKYAQADYDEDLLDDAKNYTIGVNYQYTPAIALSLIHIYSSPPTNFSPHTRTTTRASSPGSAPG